MVLAGRQKLGKTWLAIDMALAVATGGVAMGSIPCEFGDVFYIDMENGPRRIQGRINTLYPDERTRPDLSRLEWVTEAPQLDAGFTDELEHWRMSVPAPRFEKGGAEDPLESLSGSNGLSACADTTLVLDSDQSGKTLYVRGRDVEEKETALIFAGGFWSILGEAADVRRSDERTGIIATLKENDAPMTPAEIAAAAGKPALNIRQLLFKMAKAGEVHRVGKGRYSVEPLNPHNSGNADNAPDDDREDE